MGTKSDKKTKKGVSGFVAGTADIWGTVAAPAIVPGHGLPLRCPS